MVQVYIKYASNLLWKNPETLKDLLLYFNNSQISKTLSQKTELNFTDTKHNEKNPIVSQKIRRMYSLETISGSV
jgi:hypothetical protein